MNRDAKYSKYVDICGEIIKNDYLCNSDWHAEASKWLYAASSAPIV